jgi:parvulin-like peptidyl-prolyl isomerase
MNPPKVAVSILAALLMSSCGLLEPAAATVNGEKIPVEEIQKVVDEFKGSPEFARLGAQGDAEAITREFEQSYLATLIRRQVLTPLAEEKGVAVTDAEIQEQLEGIQAEFASQGAFEEALKEQGLTLDQLEQLISDRALEQKLREAVNEDLAPSDAEISSFYEDNISDFQETEAQHILVKKQSLARDIADQLHDAPKAQVRALFARLAKKHSTDKSNKADAGKLGFFTPRQFVPEFEEAANALKIGEISDPVGSEFGFHIIWVTDREPMPLDEVRGQIVAQISGVDEETAWQNWVKRAYIDAEVEVNPRYGEFNLETQQIEDASARTVPGAEETPPSGETTPEPDHTDDR